MLIFYMDDTGDMGNVGFVALGIPVETWKDAFAEINEHRRALKAEFGIPLGSEFHATEFLGGRGKAGYAVRHPQVRLDIFHRTLDVAASLKDATLLSAFDKKSRETRLYERMITRINNTAGKRKTHALVFSDEGKEERFRKLARKLGKHNPIPSQYGSWPEGAYKNIPNDNIVEDVIFRNSAGCRFIQLADFCAYALLRLERPHPSRPELSSSFERLNPIRNRYAFAKDPRGLGIIRAT